MLLYGIDRDSQRFGNFFMGHLQIAAHIKDFTLTGSQLFQCAANDILQIIEQYFIIRFIGRINRMRKDMLFQLIFIRHIPYLIKNTIAYNRI